jgi:hypothetical protein
MTDEFCTPIVQSGVLIDHIPAECTSLSQPLDIAIMYPFKCAARRHWKEWKQQNTLADGTCQRITLMTALGIISRAWGDIHPDLAAKAFQVTGLSPDENGHYRDITNINVGLHPPVQDVDDEADDDGIRFDDLEDDQIDEFA